jgi:predicted  nucleic acid-binding Zn-ribbon protein
MINEGFLQRAVVIRKTYLKLQNNLGMYLDKISKVSERLEKTIVDISELEQKYKAGQKDPSKISGDETLKQLLGILETIEQEGNNLEKSIEPLNVEMGKLAEEEGELYRLIKEKHSNLSDDQIVESVKDRLKIEGLI